MARNDSIDALNFLKQQYLPEAQQEVAAVELATSDATNRILDAAEKIQTIAKTLESTSSSRQLLEAVTHIFEASVFQDITGQRLKKITQALGAVDTSLQDLLEGKETSTKVTAKVADADKPESLLNGPQATSEAPSQDDIDKLFSSLS